MDNPILWTLICIQVLMGAFDTLVHHEGSERLAWRASQKTELRLHGVRNAFYALIFLSFAWLEPHGLWTLILGGILALEVIITLWDFVEEDMTRKLPATERVTHTLLALNYGAILAVAAPVFWAWAALPAALIPTQYGWWSVFATLSAFGVGLFSARDLLAAKRSDRLQRADPARLVAALPRRQRVLITGGTGFVGTRLVQSLVADGHDVTVLTRDIKNADGLTHPVRILTDLEHIPADEVFDAIVNLAGEGIATGLWTKSKRARITGSRCAVTAALDRLIDRLHHRPKVLVSGSAIGWYGLHGGDAPLDETAPSRPCFSHDVCAEWEARATRIERHGVRIVLLRTGLVLGVDGGILAKLLTPFEFGLGGAMGHGMQWMSWIEQDDLIRVIAFAIANPKVRGPLNAVAPTAVRNADFAKALGAALNRPAVMPIPEGVLALLGDMAKETMLGGQRVVPKALLDHGFSFEHPDLGRTLQHITGARPTPEPVRRPKAPRSASMQSPNRRSRL